MQVDFALAQNYPNPSTTFAFDLPKATQVKLTIYSMTGQELKGSFLLPFLSDREFQALQLNAAGKTADEIAEQLSLSASTVKTYRQRILQKLNLQSTAEVIHYALKNNLVD